MVTSYDVISSRWPTHVWWKCIFSQLLSKIKVKIVDNVMQNANSCVILHHCLHVKHKQLPFLAVLTWFLILGKIQDDGQDDDHCWWRHRPLAAPPPIKYNSSCWEDQRLSTERKIVSKYCNISKTLRRGSINPHPLYHGGGMNLRVRPRVKHSSVNGLTFNRSLN